MSLFSVHNVGEEGVSKGTDVITARRRLSRSIFQHAQQRHEDVNDDKRL